MMAIVPRACSASRDALRPLAEITVVAPDRNRSGASNSLTLDVPLRVAQFGERAYYVNGTPDRLRAPRHLRAVRLRARHGRFRHQRRREPRRRRAVLRHGRGRRSRAASSACRPWRCRWWRADGGHFDTAARVARELVVRLLRAPLHPSMILNVNVPDLPYEQLAASAPRGSVTGIAPSRSCVADPRGRTVYWIGPAGEGADAGAGTDFHAVAAGYVSVTPLQIDLTRHAALDDVDDWLRADASGRDPRPRVTGIGMTSARTRDRLVARLREQGIANPRVLDRIRNVPRHMFIDEALASRAYEDTALPIGFGQTISQPYIVARMTEALLEGGRRARCSKSARAAATRRRCSRRSSARIYTSSASRRCWSARGARCATCASATCSAPRRRYRGLAAARALRRDPGRGRGAGRAAALLEQLATAAG